MQSSKGITLRTALSLLVIFSVLLTGLVGGYTSMKAIRNSLAASYLESNSQYAKKLAMDTNDMLGIMQKSLGDIAKAAANPHFGETEFNLQYTRTQQYFNSILYVDSNRVVRQTSLQNQVTKGTQLTSAASRLANESKVPLISEPYIGTTGRLILLITSPVFRKDGTYAGFVGGTIYLQEDNALSRLLGHHFYGNGSYMYVVDATGHLIFHPDKNRINEAVKNNPVIENVLRGQSGAQEVVNSKGDPFFAGYAFVPKSGWGVVSQTPITVIEGPQKRLINRMLLESLPMLGLILLFVWLVAHYMAKPLYQLAKYSEEAASGRSETAASPPVVKSRIYEVNQLNQRILQHLNQLNHEIQMDGLTRLANRKAFDLTIHEWVNAKVPFSLLLLDIDHFKDVNDTFGHLTGDHVLQFLASIMPTVSREHDLCFRFGGEEFGILVKKADAITAAEIAERLRAKLAESISPTGAAVTVSIGISSYDGGDLFPDELIETADAALYRSKAEGRNKVNVG
ncbi:diguanylate cyclase [Cohnella pontilimi]|uniref:Diguanylate cyclase n=1 Tax=Cohnella pontilimi TaxID=2564100 RepID=A0A4U0FCW4_9BACL|nr:sensor domain-containing diguanylate cyclase [Cohnella pontilimi]TJY41122.1 diguanylate cyclase [Cohnella pontilimi]